MFVHRQSTVVLGVLILENHVFLSFGSFYILCEVCSYGKLVWAESGVLDHIVVLHDILLKGSFFFVKNLNGLRGHFLLGASWVVVLRVSWCADFVCYFLLLHMQFCHGAVTLVPVCFVYNILLTTFLQFILAYVNILSGPVLH